MSDLATLSENERLRARAEAAEKMFYEETQRQFIVRCMVEDDLRIANEKLETAWNIWDKEARKYFSENSHIAARLSNALSPQISLKQTGPSDTERLKAYEKIIPRLGGCVCDDCVEAEKGGK